MPRALIRQDSICDPDPKKRKEVLERMETNDDIIEAKMRYVNERAEENLRKLDEDLKNSSNLVKKISSQTLDREAEFKQIISENFNLYKQDRNKHDHPAKKLSSIGDDSYLNDKDGASIGASTITLNRFAGRSSTSVLNLEAGRRK